ncbi:SagB/ThcOx family dehydrogenase [Streptomyces sp. TRM 70351]|uniref:SagB/ThcOx family dehydrogenase n=1 Tax=Streptomyces sp. TRM 70351 TaxID=3116552 RepID=UPI002E7B16F1|nr:SagB/ThcOx family dehydrogenase [Streptomyces sp. TRM 70351]MEE1926857.1 SagB/ThcOx family dehydrogenase [Streptomyces sp. TRM 70351]
MIPTAPAAPAEALPDALAAGLPDALARARTNEVPGPATAPGPPVPPWPGPGVPVPEARPHEAALAALLRLSLAARDARDPRGRLRPAPSAGACHPVDATVTVGSGAPLPPGRYGYDPLRHRVHRLGAAPHGTAPGVRVELTVTARRTEARYGHRAWPLLLLDAGHAAAALWLAAAALGAPGAEVTLDGRAGRPLAALRLPPPGHPAAGRAQGGDAAGAPAPGELLGRRSAPPPLSGAPDETALAAVLAAAERACGPALSWCAAVGGPLPGLVATAPGGGLRRLATGEARPTLAAWAAGQGWIAGAGAVVLGYGCPDGAGPARIRRAHLSAGLAVGLAQWTAARHGLRARPVGSWQRADLGAALGRARGRDWVVHGLALSRPDPPHPAERQEPSPC